MQHKVQTSQAVKSIHPCGNVARFLLVSGLLAALVACGGGGGGGSSVTPPTSGDTTSPVATPTPPVATPTPPVAPPTPVTTVGTSGGTVSTVNDGTMLVIPAATLSTDTQPTVSVSTTAFSAPDAQTTPASKTVNVSIDPQAISSDAVDSKITIYLPATAEAAMAKLPVQAASVGSVYQVAKVKLGKVYRYVDAKLVDGTKYAIELNSQIVAAVGGKIEAVVQTVRALAEVPDGRLFKLTSNGTEDVSQSKLETARGKIPLVLVHGIQPNCMSAPMAYKTTWQAFSNFFYGLDGTSSGKYLRDRFDLYSFAYRSDQSISSNGAKLQQQLLDVFGTTKVVVLAHSMGGLVARSAVQNSNDGFQGLLTLNTPHHGTTDGVAVALSRSVDVTTRVVFNKLMSSVGINSALVGKLAGIHPQCNSVLSFAGGDDLKWDYFDNDDKAKRCTSQSGNDFLCADQIGLNHSRVNTPMYLYSSYRGPDAEFLQKISGAVLQGNLIEKMEKDDGDVPVASQQFQRYDDTIADRSQRYLQRVDATTAPLRFNLDHVQIHDSLTVFVQEGVHGSGLLSDLLVLSGLPEANNITPTVSDRMQLWVGNLWFKVKSIVLNIGGGAADVIANVVEGISEKIDAIFSSVDSKTVTATFKDGLDGTGNSLGSSMTIEVKPSTATPPTITTQPQSQSVTVGQTATFSVAVNQSGALLGLFQNLFSKVLPAALSSADSLSYQWSKNGTVISGATAASYTTPATTLADNGARFTVTVSNSAGSVTSNAAILTVTAAPVAGVDAVLEGIPASHAVGSPIRQVPATVTNSATGRLNATDSFSFALLGGGACAQDNVTGLTWEIKNSSNVAATYTNNASGASDDVQRHIDNVIGNAVCGYADWRLPTVEELQGLVSFIDRNPSINTATFANATAKTQSGNYWTQDTYQGGTTSAWVVNFSDGSAGTLATTSKAAVRLVRGAPPYPRSYVASPTLPNLPTPTRGALHDTGLGGPEGTATPAHPADVNTGRDVTRANPHDEGLGWSFVKVTASGDAPATEPDNWACVYDNVTGLTWENKTSSNAATTYTNLNNNASTDASIYVQSINNSGLCGYTDWRLPASEELQNIVHYGHGNPTISTSYFSPTANRNYWTWDSSAGDTTSAWVVNFSDGSVGTAARNSVQALRLVRGMPAYGVPMAGGPKVALPDAPAVVPPLSTPSIGALNDTGFGMEGMSAGNGQQDMQSGRDLTAYDDRDGMAGFSFTKVGSSGADVDALVINPPCVRDNVTGLLWDNVAGVNVDSNTSRYVFTNLNQPSNGYDVASVIAVFNNGTWCGRSNWRLPTTDELQNIAHYGYPGMAAEVWFFNSFLTQTGNYWTQDLYQGNTNSSWVVNFTDGSVGTLANSNTARFRLVSGEQYVP